MTNLDKKTTKSYTKHLGARQLSLMACCFLLVAAVAATPAGAAIVPITSVSTTLTAGTPDTIILNSFTAGGTLYTTATDLSLGTSVKTDTSPLDGRVIGNQDNFDLNLLFSRGASTSDNAWNTSSFGGENKWYDTNGSGADFFVFEANGNDTLNVAPIFTDNSVGQTVQIASSGTNWGNTGVTITGDTNNGQTIHGVAFAITDLKDASGTALTNDAVIKGLAFDSYNTDIASISAVTAPPLPRNPVGAASAGVTIVNLDIDGSSEVRGTSDWNTSLTVDADGNAYAAFVDKNMKNTVVKVTPGGVVTSQIIDTNSNEYDAHNTPSIVIDGDGYLHVAYNMHNHSMKLVKSPAANTVSGTWVDEGGTGTPWGAGRYTYPAMSTAPNGDVYMTIRNRDWGLLAPDGSSGGPVQLFHYDNTTKQWSSIAQFAQEDGYTGYLPAPYVDASGKVHLVWHWRMGGAGVPRHRGSYALYDPSTGKFYKADGTEYTDIANNPITHETADLYQPMEASQEYEVGGISDHSITVNALGQPVIAYNFFREGDTDQRVVRLARWDGTEWLHTDLEGPEAGATLGDPALVNRDGVLHIYFNDADGKLTLRSSYDDGLTFGDAITLTDHAVAAAHILIGTDIGDNQEAIFFMDPNDDYATNMMFVDYSQVPEPTTMSLLAIGGLALLRRRKRA